MPFAHGLRTQCASRISHDGTGQQQADGVVVHPETLITPKPACGRESRQPAEPGCARVQANSEVSALLGRIPSAVGYQPTLATDLGGLQERITTTNKGSITSVQVRASPACGCACFCTVRIFAKLHCKPVWTAYRAAT